MSGAPSFLCRRDYVKKNPKKWPPFCNKEKIGIKYYYSSKAICLLDCVVLILVVLFIYVIYPIVSWVENTLHKAYIFKIFMGYGEKELLLVNG